MTDSSPITVVIAADPGLPGQRAHAMRGEVEETLSELMSSRWMCASRSS